MKAGNPPCQGTRVVLLVVWCVESRGPSQGRAWRGRDACNWSSPTPWPLSDSGSLRSGAAHLRYGRIASIIGQVLRVLVTVARGPASDGEPKSSSLHSRERPSFLFGAPLVDLRQSFTSLIPWERIILTRLEPEGPMQTGWWLLSELLRGTIFNTNPLLVLVSGHA